MAPMDVPAPAPNAARQAFQEKLGSETDGAQKSFYLVTFSRILADTLVLAGDSR